jgi:PKD repeat protein
VEVSGFTVRQTNLTGVYADASDHLTLAGLTVSDAGSHGITVDGSTDMTLSRIASVDNLSIGVRFSNSADSALTDATTHDNQLHGVSLQGSRNVVVTRAASYANKKPGSRVAAGIDVSLGSTGCTVQDSTTYGNDDSGIEANTGATGTVFRRNLTYDNGDHGIDNSAAPGSVVVSNTVVRNATAGINFEGTSNGATTRDNVTADNAVGSTRTIGEIRVDESSAPGTSLDRDLVFQSNGGPLFEWNSQPYTRLADFRTASGQEPNGLGDNPRFADLSGRDLRLTSTSPAIDAAYTGMSAWAGLDHDGNPPVDDPSVTDTGSGPDATADLGALEYGGPAAAGSLTPTTGYAPLTVAVDGSASTGLTAPITGYSWACGNGTSVAGATGSCTYPTAGSYTATLTVTDAKGFTDTWSSTVTVNADLPPSAALTATPPGGYVPQDVVLDASGSTDGDPTPIASYTFSCGNGQTTGAQASPTTTCRYTTGGSYTASVTVTDTAGLTATRSVTVTTLADVAPTPVLTLSASKINGPGSVVADGSRSTDPDKTPVATYRFDCGNGQVTGEQTSPRTTCSYPSVRKTTNYTIRMWVTDTGGRTASTSDKVQVR